jgi:hypothetical protein
MYFEVITKEKEAGAPQNFVQFRKKLYMKGDEERMMLQIIDVSN